MAEGGRDGDGRQAFRKRSLQARVGQGHLPGPRLGRSALGVFRTRTPETTREPTTEVPAQGTHCRLIGGGSQETEQGECVCVGTSARGEGGELGAQPAVAVAKAKATLSDPGGGQVADGDCRKL